MANVVVPGAFALVHMPTTAGTAVTVALERLGLVPRGSRDAARPHLPAWEWRHDDLPVVGTVRSPWSWYWSLYHYILATQGRGKGSYLYPYLVAAGREPRRVVEAMVDPVRCGVRASGSRPPPVESLRGDGLGLYTWNVARAYAASDWLDMDAAEVRASLGQMLLIDYAIDQSDPARGLHGALTAAGLSYSYRACRRAFSGQRVLDSGWSHDPALACGPHLYRLIAERSRAALSALGYTAPGGAAPFRRVGNRAAVVGAQRARRPW